MQQQETVRVRDWGIQTSLLGLGAFYCKLLFYDLYINEKLSRKCAMLVEIV